MASDTIQLLQFMICEDFDPAQKDRYTGVNIHSNLYVPEFPYQFGKHCVVTCWRKDSKFHKEVIEYSTEDGQVVRTPHMDIEPVTDSVLFRWHKHFFPKDITIHQSSLLTIRVILDWEICFESYIMVEDTQQKPKD